MKLQELLDSVGMTKKELAEKLGVSPKTVSRMGDEVSPEILAMFTESPKPINEESEDGFRMYPAGATIPLSERVKEVEDYTIDEIRPLLKRRGGIEGDSKRTKETDYEIAHSIGLRVWEFNKLIKRFIVLCAKEGK